MLVLLNHQSQIVIIHLIINTGFLTVLYSTRSMDQKIPYDDYQLPVVFLPSYENPPAWIPPQEVRDFWYSGEDAELTA